MRARWYRTAGTAAVLLTFGLLVAGPAFGVTVASVSPTSGAVIAEESPYCNGSPVQINGTGFVNDGPLSSLVVKFGGTVADSVEVGSNTVLYVRVPKGATDGPLTVTTAAGTATSTTSFIVHQCAAKQGSNIIAGAPKPSIKSFTPTSGKSGAKVTISGSNFTGVTSVKFGGVAAKFSVTDAGTISATVPAAAKTGKIAVAGASGSSTSKGTFTKK